MHESPIVFPWPVHKHGYEIVKGALVPRAPGGIGTDALSDTRDGPLRVYHPLEDETLWLRFAQTCVDAVGVLGFAKEFGNLSGSPKHVDNRLEDILSLAALIRKIVPLIQKNKRYEAMLLFNESRQAPRMREVIVWFSGVNFGFKLLPQTLKDALFHQVGEAITGNRRFRRCRNEGCPNWFRLGPHAGSGGRGSTTVTSRREFCSDRCRVASSRRQKKEASPHA
jgi:hypothetical protein